LFLSHLNKIGVWCSVVVKIISDVILCHLTDPSEPSGWPLLQLSLLFQALLEQQCLLNKQMSCIILYITCELRICHYGIQPLQNNHRNQKPSVFRSTDYIFTTRNMKTYT
jgi:hypothetical protein